MILVVSTAIYNDDVYDIDIDDNNTCDVGCLDGDEEGWLDGSFEGDEEGWLDGYL